MLHWHRPGDQQRHQRRAGGLPVRPVWSASCDSFAEVVANVEHRWVKALTCAHFLARSARCAAERPPGNGSVLRRAPGVVGAGVVICAVRSMIVTSTPVGSTIADTRRTRWGSTNRARARRPTRRRCSRARGTPRNADIARTGYPPPSRQGLWPRRGRVVVDATRPRGHRGQPRWCGHCRCGVRRARRRGRWMHVRDPAGQITKSSLGGRHVHDGAAPSGGDIGPSRLLHPAP